MGVARGRMGGRNDLATSAEPGDLQVASSDPATVRDSRGTGGAACTDQSLGNDRADQGSNPGRPESKTSVSIPATSVPAKAPPLTTAQVAAELGVSQRTVCRLILSGELLANVVSTTAKRQQYRVTPWALRTYQQRHHARIDGRGRS